MGLDLSTSLFLFLRHSPGTLLIMVVFTNRPTLSLFMWESGSYFDGLCNEIQNDPAALYPRGSVRALIAGLGVDNGTLAG